MVFLAKAVLQRKVSMFCFRVVIYLSRVVTLLVCLVELAQLDLDFSEHNINVTPQFLLGGFDGFTSKQLLVVDPILSPLDIVFPTSLSPASFY